MQKKQKRRFALLQTQRFAGNSGVDYFRIKESLMDIGVLFKIAGIGLLAAIINTILRKSDKEEIATITTLASLVIVLLIVLDMIASLFDSIKSIFSLY